VGRRDRGGGGDRAGAAARLRGVRALIAAAVISVGAAWTAARLLAAAGGFAGHPFPLTLAPLSQLWTHTWLTGWGILELYGGNFIGVTGWVGVAFAALRLIGLTLAIAALAVALGRFIRPRVRGGAGGAGVHGRPGGWSQWTDGAESRDRSKMSIFISLIFFLVIAGYTSAFGYSAAQAAAPGQDSALAGWLVAHGLRYGLGQSSANVVTLDSGAGGGPAGRGALGAGVGAAERVVGCRP
jgi:hypothetical protein